MENWEKQLNQVNVPDPIVSSHRDGLRKKLQSGGIPTGHGIRNTVTFGIAALLLISGLTAVYPSWAKDLLNTTLVQTITFQTKDGMNVRIMKVSGDQCSTVIRLPACRQLVFRPCAVRLRAHRLPEIRLLDVR
jgi:hypothetical protein